MIGNGSALNEDEMYCVLPRPSDRVVEVAYFRTQPQPFRLRAQVVTWDAVVSNALYDGNGIGLSAPPTNSVLLSSVCVVGFVGGPMTFAVSGFFTFSVTEIKTTDSGDLLEAPIFATQQDLGSGGNNPAANRRVALQTVLFDTSVRVNYQVMQFGGSSASVSTSGTLKTADFFPMLMATQGLCSSGSASTPIGPSLLVHLMYDNVTSPSSRISAERADGSSGTLRCPMALVDVSGVLYTPTTVSTTPKSLTLTTIQSSVRTTPRMSVPLTTRTSSMASTFTVSNVTTAPLTSSTTAEPILVNADVALIGGIVGGVLALMLLVFAVVCVMRRNKTKRTSSDTGAMDRMNSGVVAVSPSPSTQYEILPLQPVSSEEPVYGSGQLSPD